MNEASGASRERSAAGVATLGVVVGVGAGAARGTVVGTGLSPAEVNTCSASSPPRLATSAKPSTQKTNLVGMPGAPSARAAFRSTGAAGEGGADPGSEEGRVGSFPSVSDECVMECCRGGRSSAAMTTRSGGRSPHPRSGPRR